MSDVPEIQIDPINGPRLVLTNSVGQRRDVCLTSNGTLALSGETFDELDFCSIPPLIEDEETGTAGWSLKGTLESGNFKAGNHELTISFNWRNTTSSKSFLLELIQDDDYDNPIWEMKERPKTSADQMIPSTKVLYLQNLTEGVHKFEVWFRCEENNKMAYMSKLFMKIERKP